MDNDPDLMSWMSPDLTKDGGDFADWFNDTGLDFFLHKEKEEDSEMWEAIGGNQNTLKTAYDSSLLDAEAASELSLFDTDYIEVADSFATTDIKTAVNISQEDEGIQRVQKIETLPPTKEYIVYSLDEIVDEPIPQVLSPLPLSPTQPNSKFSCDRCSSSFTRHSSLKQHISSIHTKSQLYVCTECGKQYNVKSNLSRHMLMHTGERPYTCSFCEKSFTQSSSLVRHTRICKKR